MKENERRRKNKKERKDETNNASKRKQNTKTGARKKITGERVRKDGKEKKKARWKGRTNM
jgi:hypothetical protein